MNLGRIMDIAYNEYGDPFRLLLNKGVANKSGVINGLMNDVPVDPARPLPRPPAHLPDLGGPRLFVLWPPPNQPADPVAQPGDDRLAREEPGPLLRHGAADSALPGRLAPRVADRDRLRRRHAIPLPG